MKRLCGIIVILLIALFSYSQVLTKKDLNPLLIKSGLMLVSAFCDGTSEVLKIKYEDFKRVFPNANDQFWDYNISWVNKYHNGIPPTPKFPFSKTGLVFTTDGYHLMRMMRNCTMVVGVTIPLGSKPKNWKTYVTEGLILYGAYTIGFNMSYDVIFK